MKARHGGFTLIELAVVVAMLGLVASLLMQLVPALKRSTGMAQSVRNLDDVEAALVAFAAINGRLPCPDTAGDGVEHMAGATCTSVIGKFPYLTLGFSYPLVNAAGLDFRYAVHSRAGVLNANVQLEKKQERFQPQIGSDAGSGVALGSKSIYAGANGRLDFCQALRTGMDYNLVPGPSASYLYIQGAAAKTNVAYVLVDPGVGDMDLVNGYFDGLNGSASDTNPGFESPLKSGSARSLLSAGYDDRVVVGYFDQLWETLGCSATMTTVGHAQANVETTAALLEQSLADYKVQLVLAKDMAYADNFSAGATLASAVAGLASAGASMATDIASAINTFGATSGAAVSAGIAIGLNAAQVAVSSVALALTVTTYKDFNDDPGGVVAQFNTLVSTKMDPLYSSIQANVQTSGQKAFSSQ